MGQRTVTVACVLRSGGDYTADHVRHLLCGVARHWDWDYEPMLRVVVLTDQADAFVGGEWSVGRVELQVRPLHGNWKGWWSKMALFSPENADLGDLLYFDLDTVICGGLRDIAGVGRLTLLDDFYVPLRAQSGMMYLSAEDRAEVWEQWDGNAMRLMRLFRGDGNFLDALWRQKAARWQRVIPDQVVSYKIHVQGRARIPAAARVVCFHGRPRPWQARNPNLWE